MAKKKTVPLNSEEALAHLSAGLGGIPMRYGNGPSVTAVPDRANSRQQFDVSDVQKAGVTLAPLKCRGCGSNEVTYNQSISDAHCADCGEWQSNLRQRF